MATINLGNIKFNWKGTYAAGTAYVIDDVVSYNGSSYIAKTATTGNLPTVTANWDVMSLAGTNGTDVGTTITTQGDILFRDGSGLQRLAKGTAGQALKINAGATAPEWGTIDDTFGSKLLHVTKDTQNFSTTGSWTKIDVDTVRTNEISGASVSGGVISLPAGTYLSQSFTAFYRVNGYNNKLRNTTDGADLLIGSGGHTWSNPNDASSPCSHINGKFTLSGTKNVEMQYYVESANGQASIQGGHPNQVLLWKVA